MNKKSHIVVVFVIVCLVLAISETFNFFSDPNSQISQYLISKQIDKASAQARDGRLDSALLSLSIASKINYFGDFLVRHKIPMLFSPPIKLSLNYPTTQKIYRYLSTAGDLDYVVTEDKGLGKIYYDLGLISHETNSELTPLFFLAAIYNNPEFPAFHAEYINYFYAKGDLNEAEKAINFCFGFNAPKILCSSYKDNNMRYGVPVSVGFLREEVENNYLK